MSTHQEMPKNNPQVKMFMILTSRKVSEVQVCSTKVPIHLPFQQSMKMKSNLAQHNCMNGKSN